MQVHRAANGKKHAPSRLELDIINQKDKNILWGDDKTSNPKSQFNEQALTHDPDDWLWLKARCVYSISVHPAEKNDISKNIFIANDETINHAIAAAAAVDVAARRWTFPSSSSFQTYNCRTFIASNHTTNLYAVVVKRCIFVESLNCSSVKK